MQRNLKEWGGLYLVNNHLEENCIYPTIIVGFGNKSDDIVLGIYQTTEEVSEYLVYFLHNGQYEKHKISSFGVDWDIQITEGAASEFRVDNEAKYLSGIIESVDNKKIEDAISKFKTTMQKSDKNNFKENLRKEIKLLKNELDTNVIRMTNGVTIGLDDIRFPNGIRIRTIYHEKQTEYEQKKLSTEKFDSRLKENILITEIEIKNFYDFNIANYKPKPNINIILGRNGLKKTEFLKVLAAILMSAEQNSDTIDKYKYLRDIIENQNNKDDFKINVKAITQNEDLEISISGTKDGFVFGNEDLIPVLIIPDNRSVDKRNTKMSIKDMESKETKEILRTFDYFISDDSFAQVSNHILKKIQLEILFGDYLDETDGNKKRYSFAKFRNSSEKFSNSISKLIEDILKDIISDESFQFDSFQLLTSGDNIGEIMVKTEGSSQLVPIQKISKGTFSILFIFGSIYCYLQAKFPNQDTYAIKYIEEDDNLPEPRPATLSDQPAIAFIDEIDAHVHPTVQKKIVPMLRKTFPNIQFFIVAHNALTIKGCYQGEVSVIRKEKGTNMTKLTQKNIDTIGESSANILDDFFETDDIDDNFIDLLIKNKTTSK